MQGTGLLSLSPALVQLCLDDIRHRWDYFTSTKAPFCTW